jgi:hypothetical protein
MRLSKSTTYVITTAHWVKSGGLQPFSSVYPLEHRLTGKGREQYVGMEASLNCADQWAHIGDIAPVYQLE